MGSWRGAKRHEGSCSGCCCPSRVETRKNTRTGVVVERRRVTFWPAGAAASCRLAIRSVWRCSAAVPGTTQAAVWPISSQMNTSVQPIDPPLQIETFPAPWRKVAAASWCGRVPTPGRASGGPHADPANWEINPDAHYATFCSARRRSSTTKNAMYAIEAIWMSWFEVIETLEADKWRSWI